MRLGVGTGQEQVGCSTLTENTVFLREAPQSRIWHLVNNGAMGEAPVEPGTQDSETSVALSVKVSRNVGRDSEGEIGEIGEGHSMQPVDFVAHL